MKLVQVLNFASLDSHLLINHVHKHQECVLSKESQFLEVVSRLWKMFLEGIV